MIPLSTHPESGRIYATIKGRPGQRAKKISLGVTSVAAARRLIKESGLEEIQQVARADALNAEAITRLRAGKKTSVSSAIAAWIEMLPAQGDRQGTIRHANTVLTRWVRLGKIESLPLAALTAEHVSAFVNEKSTRKFSTRKRELMVLRSFLKFCLNRGWIAVNPALDVSVNVDQLTQEQLTDKESIPFTDDEIKKIVRETDKDDFWHAATIIARDTGLRLFNVATLEWSSLASTRLRVFTTKGESVVDCEMTPDMRALFDRWPRSQSRYIFPPQAASITVGGPSTLSQQFRRLCVRLGIEGKSFNCLRHSFAMRQMVGVTDAKLKMLADLIGVGSVDEVRMMLGHAKASMTLRYLNHPAKK